MPHKYLIPLAALLCVQRTNLCHQEVVEIFKFLQVPLHELSYLLLMVSGRLYRYRCNERTRTSSSAKELFYKTTQCCRFVLRGLLPIAGPAVLPAGVKSNWKTDTKDHRKEEISDAEVWSWYCPGCQPSGLSMSVHQCAHIPVAPATNSRDRERSKSYQMLIRAGLITADFWVIL